MPKISAGLLIYRIKEDKVEVLLVHPGGPFWGKNDLGAWTIPKGEAEKEEDLLETAKREVREETGFEAKGKFKPIGTVMMHSCKIIHAWAIEADFDTKNFKSNFFEVEWPPKSGRKQNFPEVDQVQYFDMETARAKINRSQIEFLDRFEQLLISSFSNY